MNADGTNVQRLTNLEELEGQAHSPAWSPDGTQIAYIGRISTLPWRLRIINVDGTGDQAITPENFCMSSVPDWAPDASRIMVEGSVRREPRRVLHGGAGRQQPRALPNTADDGDRRQADPRTTAPAFSPDGTRIVFGQQWVHPQCAGAFGLMSQRLDGTDRRTVVTGTERERVLRRAGLAADPVHWLRRVPRAPRRCACRWWSRSCSATTQTVPQRLREQDSTARRSSTLPATRP